MAAATENANLKIGFLGLGIMGVAMVRYCLPEPTPNAPMQKSIAWHASNSARLTRKVIKTLLSKQSRSHTLYGIAVMLPYIMSCPPLICLCSFIRCAGKELDESGVQCHCLEPVP